jgi:hypothetical protein
MVTVAAATAVLVVVDVLHYRAMAGWVACCRVLLVCDVFAAHLPNTHCARAAAACLRLRLYLFHCCMPPLLTSIFAILRMVPRLPAYRLANIAL